MKRRPPNRQHLSQAKLDWLAISAVLLFGLTGVRSAIRGMPFPRLQLVALIVGVVMLVVQIITTLIKRRRP
jgi:hypothetical protein